VYVLALVDEFVPLYPVYALLFADAGLSAAQISALFAVWSLAGFVLEVPSGALADRVSRRHLLAASALLRAAGFALWLVWPSFTGFAIGFLLWGVSGAFTSGTWEALVYDELAAVGASDRYVTVIGRAELVQVLGVLGGTAAAAPLVALGGFQAAGWVSVAICVLAAALPLTLPARHIVLSADGTGFRGYVRTLRAGLAEAATHPAVRRLLLAAALLGGFDAVDEYLPLLTREFGASPAAAPLLLLAPYAALAAGAAVADRAATLSPRGTALLTAAGAVTFAAGVLAGHPAGFVAIAAGYGTLTCLSLVAGARLQDAITGPRATVTSVSGFGAETTALALFAVVGAGSARADLPILLAATTVPILLLAAVLPRWRRPA
jgi:MFS family permease